MLGRLELLIRQAVPAGHSLGVDLRDLEERLLRFEQSCHYLLSWEKSVSWSSGLPRGVMPSQQEINLAIDRLRAANEEALYRALVQVEQTISRLEPLALLEAEPTDSNPLQPDLTENDDLYVLWREADHWRVQFAGEAETYAARKDGAFRYLVKVLANPGRNLDVNTLCEQPRSEMIPNRAAGKGAEDASDSQALDASEEELRRLVREIREAEAANDDETAQKLRQEFDTLADHVQKEKGFAGRKKKLGPKSPAEKAHHAIATALRRLSSRLGERMPELAGHLAKSLKYDFPHIGYFPVGVAPAWHINF
jgi:hypothetical protein